MADSTQSTETVAPAAETVAPVTPVAQPFVKQTPQVPTTHTAYFGGDPNAQHATQAVTEESGVAIKPEGKLLTQEQVNAIVQERLAKATAKYADYDDLKAKASAADEATRTEAEKQAAKLKELETQTTTLAQERAKLLVEISFKDAAGEIGLPGDAAYKLADMSQAKFGEDGRITNAKELAAAVAQQYPGLVKRGAASASVVNPGRGDTAAQRTDADRRRDLLTPGGGSFFQQGRVIMPTNLATGE